MNAGKQAMWLFLALISLGFFGWYFASTTPKPKLDANTLTTTADAMISNLNVQQFNSDGLLVHTLETPLVKHIPKDNTHWFKSPIIKVAQENGPAWEIQALQAHALHGGETITFSNDVIAYQAAGPKTPESIIKTDEITYFPQKKEVLTEKIITLQQPGTFVESKGMKAYLTEKRVQLLSRARGIYEPNHG